MLLGIRRFFGIDYILPVAARLGPVPATKSIYKEYIDVAWPATMQGLLLQLMTAINLAMVGALGADALAAVGIMSQPLMVMLVFVRSAAIAITAIVARRKGEENYVAMNSVLKQGVILTILFYLPLLALSYYFLPAILSFAGAQPSYITTAVGYGEFIVIGLFFSALSVMMGAALIGVGNTRIIFTSNAIGNVLNVCLNFALIYGWGPIPALGVIGSGIATMTSYILICLLLWRAIHTKDKHLSWKQGSWRFDKDILRSIYYIGGSSLGEQAFERFGMFAYTKMVASLGVVALATHHICMNLIDIFYYFAMGLSYSGASYTGQSLGKKRPDLAMAYGKIGIRIALFISIVGLIVYFGLRNVVFDFFTQDQGVWQLGSQIMILMAIASFPQAFQLVYSGVLKGAGDNFYVMKYSLFVIAIFRPIITYLLCFTWGFGLYGAWIALLIDQSLRMVFAGWRFRSGVWQHIKI
ncbi:MATE family efflux transporter [Veillonella intestinalis]|uniref:MATE family efflux transporter n=1 Tax=Veillonella intestinalis TaxID=2941341 RepID=UPI00203ABC8A|nr:MATE family efflux transporter [Veillonella intestinalis]